MVADDEAADIRLINPEYRHTRKCLDLWVEFTISVFKDRFASYAIPNLGFTMDLDGPNS